MFGYFFMNFIKNFIALCISTIVWAAGLWVIPTVYFIFTTQDFFYSMVLGVCILVVGAGVILGKYNTRVQAALEIPLGILSL